MAKVAKRSWTYKGEKKTAWVVRWRDNKGVRRQETFEQKKAADKFRLEVENEVSDGTNIARSDSVTVAVACEMYLRHCEDKVKDGRIGKVRLKSLNNSIGRSVKQHLGAVLFKDLTAKRVEQFYYDLLRDGGLEPRTVKQRILDLHLLEQFALKQGLIAKPVVPAVLKELRGIVYKNVRTFTSDQALAVLQASDVKPYNGHRRPWALARCYVYIAAFCGLRFGEISGLTIENVDFHRHIFKVRHSLTAFDELKGPKTRAGIRDVPMPDQVAALIREWLSNWYVDNDRGLLFRTPKGGRMTPASFHVELWQKILQTAGLGEGERFHFHALRHFCASWMIENGLPVTEVALLLGHSKFDTTLQTYAHPVVGAARRHEAISRMTDSLLLPPPMLDGATLPHRALTD